MPTPQVPTKYPAKVGDFTKVYGDGCAIHRIIGVDPHGVTLDSGCSEAWRKLELLTEADLRKTAANNREYAARLLTQADMMEAQLRLIDKVAAQAKREAQERACKKGRWPR